MQAISEGGLDSGSKLKASDFFNAEQFANEFMWTICI